MKIQREFTAQVPIERAWACLSDSESLASSVFGGKQRNPTGELIYNGELSLSDNGTVTSCRTSLRPIELDEDTLSTRLRVQGREVGGPALGVGTLHGWLTAKGEATRVSWTADFAVAGYGGSRDLVEDRADALLGTFAKRLQDLMQREPAPRASAPRPPADDEPAPVGFVRRRGPLVALVLAVLLLLGASAKLRKSRSTAR